MLLLLQTKPLLKSVSRQLLDRNQIITTLIRLPCFIMNPLHKKQLQPNLLLLHRMIVKIRPYLSS
ncbi:unnamed protein product [Hymenolepis diminuta]|uniref:Uncharacterized protein n=1 Tax=Hymenolepis diminuta TaxID=6216 RepID=A0A564ZCK4_HYMDI|nr:unnamed protein product [Hymenolepis diminuta]